MRRVRFKEGDSVVCIDDLYYELTIDKVYIVLEKYKDDNTIWVINDKGRESYYHYSLFISVMEKRNEVIDEILKY